MSYEVGVISFSHHVLAALLTVTLERTVGSRRVLGLANNYSISGARLEMPRHSV